MPHSARTVMTATALVAVVAGCGSQSHASTSTAARGSLTQAHAASVYLADIAHVNAEGSRLGQAFTSSTSNAQLARDAKPFVVAARAVDRQFLILAGRYPPAASALEAEVRSDARLIAGFQDPDHLTTRALQDDIDTTHTAANTVRARLGLPQHQ